MSRRFITTPISENAVSIASLFMHDLRSKRISPFHGESSLAHLRRVCRGDAGELRSDVVDDVEVAVGPVVIPQAKIGADCLRV